MATENALKFMVQSFLKADSYLDGHEVT